MIPTKLKYETDTRQPILPKVRYPETELEALSRPLLVKSGALEYFFRPLRVREQAGVSRTRRVWVSG